MNTTKKILLSFCVGYLLTNAVNYVLAADLLRGVAGPLFKGLLHTRPEQQLSVLFAGFVVPVVCVTIVTFMASRPASWIVRGALAGLLVGMATFTGGSLAAPVWKHLPSFSTFTGALFNSLSLVLGGIVIAYVQR